VAADDKLIFKWYAFGPLPANKSWVYILAKNSPNLQVNTLHENKTVGTPCMDGKDLKFTHEMLRVPQ
jgi:hypothetical protein